MYSVHTCKLLFVLPLQATYMLGTYCWTSLNTYASQSTPPHVGGKHLSGFSVFSCRLQTSGYRELVAGSAVHVQSLLAGHQKDLCECEDTTHTGSSVGTSMTLWPSRPPSPLPSSFFPLASSSPSPSPLHLPSPSHRRMRQRQCTVLATHCMR